MTQEENFLVEKPQPVYDEIDIIQQSEQPHIPKGLDEAAEEYRRKTCNEACKNGFLDNHPSPSIKTAFIAGAKWDREQMMKEAVEGRVVDAGIFATYNTPVEYTHFGDKVRIIIVKEDEK